MRVFVDVHDGSLLIYPGNGQRIRIFKDDGIPVSAPEHMSADAVAGLAHYRELKDASIGVWPEYRGDCR